MEDQFTWFVKQTPSVARATEDLEGSPSSRTSSVDRPPSALWVPLRRSDQKKLESALLAAEVGLGAVERVTVDGGRAEVNIEERCYSDRFGVMPAPAPKPVRRVRWLRHAGGIDGTWQPYSEQMDERIEFAYSLLMESAGESLESEVPRCSHFAREVPLNDDLNSVVGLRFSLSIDEVSGEPQWNMVAEEKQIGCESPKRNQSERPERGSVAWFQELKDAAFTVADKGLQRTPVKRCYGEVPLLDGCQEEEMLGEDVSRLVVYVHGIGGEESDSEGARCLRRNLHRSQLQAIGIEEDAEGNWGPEDKMATAQFHPKTEVIEVFWDQDNPQTKAKMGPLNDQLERTSLPSMPRVREIMNRASHGYILYARWRREIMDAVQESVEAAVKRFRACYPEFVGEILLVGHSLAGVAMFELLVDDSLTFQDISSEPPQPDMQASALYALGSPIGQLVEPVLQDADIVPQLRESKFPCGTRFFNIYHPLDPVACRTEPLLMPELAGRAPAKVPTERLPDLQAFLARNKKEDADDNLSDCGSVVSSTRASSAPGNQEQQQQRAARLAEFIGLRLYGRLDWVLQNESGCEVMMSEELPDAALTSHLSYIRSFDLAAFLHASSIQILQPAEPDRPPPVAKVVETKLNIFGQTVVKNPDAGSFWERKSFWERASSGAAAGGLAGLRRLADSTSRGSTLAAGASDIGSDGVTRDTSRGSVQPTGFWGKAKEVAAAKLEQLAQQRARLDQ